MSASIAEGTSPGAASPEATTSKAPRGSGPWRYLITRFLLIIPTVWILTTTVFFMMRITGDPITAAMGGRLTPAELERRVQDAGYDRPVIVQYFEYMGGLLRGDFGTAVTTGQPVTQILFTYGTATLELVIYAVGVALLVGIPLGLIAAKWRDRAPDAFLRIFAILCYATPVFFAGLLLKLVFAVAFPIFDASGRASSGNLLILQGVEHPTGIYLLDALRLGDLSLAADVVSHAVLPATALGLLTAGVFLRLVRTNLIGTLSQGYIESGRARGISEYRLVTKHAYRPALIPIITVMGMQVAMMLGGAILTETTFEWNGLGYQLSQYLQARDFVAVQGIVTLMAVIVAVTNFVVDVVAALIDPRVRY